MPKKRIYLDYAATTPVDKRVMKAMTPYFSEKFGNPSSVHIFGQEASKAVEKAREKIAVFFNCSPTEIIFTSGATESNNLAIKGAVKKFYTEPKNKGIKPRLITDSIEHSCVLNTCRSLEKEGLAEVVYIAPNKEGIIQIKDIAAAINENTLLVSIMYVNNEIGTIQPIATIGKFLEKENANRKRKILFHTDATQAVNYLDCDVEKLGVDLLSLSGHKIYGPKGVGALYVKKGTLLTRIQDGGEQERKMRAGTHNVPAIVGLGKALELVMKEKSKIAIKTEKLRDYLIARVLKEIPQSYLNGSAKKRIPNNANFRFDNVEGEGLLLSLDLEGIAVSTGSACASRSLEPSHVLLALGLKHEQAHGSLRLTLGKTTTRKEIDLVVNKLKVIIERLRKISGDVLKSFQ